MRHESLPPVREMRQAVREKDPQYDGIFYLGVRTTGIFCRPSCRAKAPRLENVEFFPTIKEAMFAGYRPCKRCKPAAAPDGEPGWARDLIRRIDASPEERIKDGDLRAMGLDPARVRRQFMRTHGMTFHAYARARRMGRALSLLRGGASIDDVVLDHGYESHSGFREAFAKLVGTPPGRARASRPAVTVERVETPLGGMIAGATDSGICLLEFTDRRAIEAQLASVQRRFGGPVVPGAHPMLGRLKKELEAYFDGKLRRFSVPLAYPGTEFQVRVWNELLRIPYGETRSYVDLARKLGMPGAARAVGRANGQNRIAIVIPCHRVVNAGGELGGYGGGLRRKEYLLRLEGGARASLRP